MERGVRHGAAQGRRGALIPEKCSETSNDIQETWKLVWQLIFILNNS